MSPAVGSGGVSANDLQKRMFRAGHAHAGVIVILGLVVALYVDLAGVSGVFRELSRGVLIAAILMPAGFFLSVVGRDPLGPTGSSPWSGSGERSWPWAWPEPASDC